MKVSFECNGQLLQVDGGVLDRLELLDGAHSDPEFDLENFLDFPLAKIGIIGGASRCIITASRVRLATEYWCPRKLDKDVLSLLTDFTLGQWADGIGEGGISVTTTDGLIAYVQPIIDSEVIIRETNDGVDVPPPPPLAVAIIDRNLERANQLLDAGENPNGEVIGMSSLELAISFGYKDLVLRLLTNGADYLRINKRGESLLHVCAYSELSDHDSASVASQLIDKGLDPNLKKETGHTPLVLANSREKSPLAKVLSEHTPSN